MDPDAPPAEHPDPATRAARGRAARERHPRSGLGAWGPSPDRGDAVAVLLAQEAGRVPELLGIRHERMRESPFAFYRGAAAVMAADLATMAGTGLTVQCSGDAHLANFGGFLAPDRVIVFDINDFDETNPGPFEWDVARLAASVLLAARSRDFDDGVGREMVRRAVRGYREAMREFAQMRTLDVWYSRLDLPAIRRFVRDREGDRIWKRFERRIGRTRGKDHLRAFSKLVETVDGRPRIVYDPPLVVPIREMADQRDPASVRAWVDEVLERYRSSLHEDRRHLFDRYRVVDIARKVVGVGSVGTRCWIVFLLGRDDSDPLFLQVKEATASVLEPFAGASAFDQHGRRVVEGQRLLQSASDVMLGWMRAPALDGTVRDFYVRQLWDGKVTAALDRIVEPSLRVFGELCGHSLARAHARTGDPIAIDAYLGTSDRFDDSLVAFAETYARVNAADYEAFVAALDAGAA